MFLGEPKSVTSAPIVRRSIRAESWRWSNVICIRRKCVVSDTVVTCMSSIVYRPLFAVEPIAAVVAPKYRGTVRMAGVGDR